MRIKSIHIFSILAGLMLMALALGAVQAAPASGGKGAQAKVTVSNLVGGKKATAFSATLYRSIFVTVNWKGLTGAHTMHLLFYSPDGELYQDQPVYFTVASGLPAREDVFSRSLTRWQGLQLPGVLYPVDQQVVQASGSSGNLAIWGELPLAGSWAQRLTGNWRVDVTLDNDDATVLGGAKFSLTP